MAKTGVYRRVEEVLDCWFESGSMPYAQLHYPFENQQTFEQGFPAEYIAEGLDQTRGWFYTLMVLAGALFQKPAFRNVIVNGMVLAADGKKMSKSLRNYTPGDELMETYGADALRLYLINSGLVRAEEQRFVDRGVRDMVRRALLPWYNAWSFLETYAAIDGWTPAKGTHRGDQHSRRLDHLPAADPQGEHRRGDETLPALQRGAEAVLVHRRPHQLVHPASTGRGSGAKGITGGQDRRLQHAAHGGVRIVRRHGAVRAVPVGAHLSCRSPSSPARSRTPLSVHLCTYPEAEPSLREPLLEDAVSRMQQVIELGRSKREQVKINLRTPLRTLTIVHRDSALLDEIGTLENYLKAELNVKEVRYETDESSYIALYAKPNFPVLGKRLGRRMREFQGEDRRPRGGRDRVLPGNRDHRHRRRALRCRGHRRLPGGERGHRYRLEPVCLHRTRLSARCRVAA